MVRNQPLKKSVVRLPTTVGCIDRNLETSDTIRVGVFRPETPTCLTEICSELESKYARRPVNPLKTIPVCPIAPPRDLPKRPTQKTHSTILASHADGAPPFFAATSGSIGRKSHPPLNAFTFNSPKANSSGIRNPSARGYTQCFSFTST